MNNYIKKDAYYNKYLKYKNKYLKLKQMLGGSNNLIVDEDTIPNIEQFIEFSKTKNLIEKVKGELIIPPKKKINDDITSIMNKIFVHSYDNDKVLLNYFLIICPYKLVPFFLPHA
jgi:pectate lyase